MTHRDTGATGAASESTAMAHACRVADAVLNEGHLVCPDRASAANDRLRRQSGVLVPPGYTTTDEPSCSVTECLLEAAPDARLHVRLRFLHLRTRTVERAEGGCFHPVRELTAGGRTYRTSTDATERETEVALCLSDLLCAGETPAAVPAGVRHGRSGADDVRGDDWGDDAGAGAPADPWRAGAAGERTIMVGVPGDWSADPIEDERGQVVGRIVTEQLSLRAAIRVRATRPCGPYGLTKLRVTVANTHGWADAAAPRDHALRRSLLATHLLIGVSGGAFLSPADPPEWAKDAATRCRCQHCWPVLAGPPGSREVLLSAPIILYDHPAVPDTPEALVRRADVDGFLGPRVQAGAEGRCAGTGTGAGMATEAGTGTAAGAAGSAEPGRNDARERREGRDPGAGEAAERD